MTSQGRRSRYPAGRGEGNLIKAAIFTAAVLFGSDPVVEEAARDRAIVTRQAGEAAPILATACAEPAEPHPSGLDSTGRSGVPDSCRDR